MYYKFLNKDGTTAQGYGKWHLNGKWMPEIKGDLVACKNGYHVMRFNDLIHWFGENLYRVKIDDDFIESDTKIVTRRARIKSKVYTWNERTARLFACDCAERAMNNHGNGDKRSYEAIRIARLFANGRATKEELNAARDAAGAAGAAGAAAGAAAWAAARAAWAAWAAWDAAGAAAGAAARAAAWAAARDAEQRWQIERLNYYLKEDING